MKSILTSTALATVLAFGLAAGSGVVRAQDAQQPEMNQGQSNECIGENCPGGAGEGAAGKKMKKPDTQMDEQAGEEATPRKKKRMGTQQDTDVDVKTGEETVTRKKKRVGVQQDTNVDVDVNAKVQAGETRWRFDPNRHQRRKSKSATFRFFYNGYYYPQPYWTEVYVVGPGRISCGEGRAIVAQRFNRVRVVECRGGTYTYLGRREGDTFRIIVNSRTGRIVGRSMI
jgi:hypothetical protein